MLFPSIFGEDMFSNWPSFNDLDKVFYNNQRSNTMRTDVKETDDAYELTIDLAGYKKDEITAEVKDGYLTVSAEKSEEKEEKQEGVYIRRERFMGNISRSYFVGDSITETDIHAKFQDGILSVDIPKETPKSIEDARKFVAIEG